MGAANLRRAGWSRGSRGDPRPRKRTVGALRAQAKHVSIEPALGLGGAAPVRDPNKPVTSGDINRMFASADAQTAL